MADPIKPENPVITPTVDNNSLKKGVEEAKKIYGELTETVKEHAEKLKGIDLGNISTKIKAAFTKLAVPNINMGPLEEMASAFTNLGTKAILLSTAVGRDFINPLGSAADMVKHFGVGAAAINKSFSDLLVTQSVVRSAFVMMGEGLDKADAAASMYPQSLRRMSASLNISTKDLHEMTNIVRQVPGAFTETSGKVLGLGVAAEQTLMPTAVLATAMTAFGMSASESAKMAKDAWFNFNQDIPATLKQVGLMAAASKASGVDMGTAREQIEKASGSLAIFGQGSAAAANIWTTFMTSLRGSGVPIKEIDAMVAQLTGSFGGMDLKTKAFISTMSGMSGGKTAIGGAIQMEMNMRSPGGLEKNIEMLTKSLTQISGGKIITLEEAANNPQLEAQFIIQRDMLKQMGVAGTAEQQNRVLEVMKNVQTGGISQLEGGKALESAVNKGKDIQAQQLTALEKIVINTRNMMGGEADTTMEAFTKTMSLGKLTGEEREKGGVAGLQTYGYSAGMQPTSTDGRRNSQIDVPYAREAADAAGRALKQAVPAALEASMKDVKAPDGFLNKIWESFKTSGTKALESATPTKPVEAATHKFTIEAKPAEDQTSKILGNMQQQQKNDLSPQAVEELIKNLNSKVEETSKKKAETEEKSGSNSVLTIRIMSDEDTVLDVVKKALQTHSKSTLNYGNNG